MKQFIDFSEQIATIYWCGIPYYIESSFNGRFYNVLDINEESIDQDLECVILDKYFRMRKKICS